VCDSVSAGQAIDYETHFSTDFKKAVPKVALDSILAKVRRQYGPCQGWYIKQKRTDHSGRILTRHSNGKELGFSLTVSPTTGVITELMTLGKASRVWEPVWQNKRLATACIKGNVNPPKI